MTPESVTTVIPLPVKILSPNCPIASKIGRYMKASATKRLRRLVKEAVETEQIETAPWRRVSVQAIFYHKTKRRRDQDNAMGSLKAAYDGIVDAGLVLDDDHKHMEKMPPVFRCDKRCPRVVLIVTRCL